MAQIFKFKTQKHIFIHIFLFIEKSSQSEYIFILIERFVVIEMFDLKNFIKSYRKASFE